jgi:hypothetical protein
MENVGPKTEMHAVAIINGLPFAIQILRIPSETTATLKSLTVALTHRATLRGFILHVGRWRTVVLIGCHLKIHRNFSSCFPQTLRCLKAVLTEQNLVVNGINISNYPI